MTVKICVLLLLIAAVACSAADDNSTTAAAENATAGEAGDARDWCKEDQDCGPKGKCHRGAFFKHCFCDDGFKAEHGAGCVRDEEWCGSSANCNQGSKCYTIYLCDWAPQQRCFPENSAPRGCAEPKLVP